MYEAQKHNATWKKSDVEEYILHDTIQFKFKKSPRSKGNNYSDKSHRKVWIMTVSGAGALVMFYILTWVVVTFLCSLHTNLSNSILEICPSYCIYVYFNLTIFNSTEPEKKEK